MLGLNKRAQACSETFWRRRVSHSMTSWCLGRSLHCPVVSVKGQKSKLPWNAVMRSWRQPAVKTCDDVHDWQCVSVEDFDGADDGESMTILQTSGRGVCCDKKKIQLSQRLTDGVEAELRQLANDCLRVFRYSFVAFNLAESVSLSINQSINQFFNYKNVKTHFHIRKTQSTKMYVKSVNTYQYITL